MNLPELRGKYSMLSNAFVNDRQLFLLPSLRS